jgi:hypothetical protein
MIFARRAAFPPQQIAALEYRTLVPDAPGFGLVNSWLKAIARQEVARAKREMGDLRIVQDLEEATK